MTVEIYNKLKSTGGVPDAELRATLEASAHHAARLVPELAGATPPRRFIIHNVNFLHPSAAATLALRRTIPGQLLAPGLFSPQDDDGTHRLIYKVGEDISPLEPLTDYAALAAGWISHTVLDYTQLGVRP